MRRRGPEKDCPAPASRRRYQNRLTPFRPNAARIQAERHVLHPPSSPRPRLLERKEIRDERYDSGGRGDRGGGIVGEDDLGETESISLDMIALRFRNINGRWRIERWNHEEGESVPKYATTKATNGKQLPLNK